MKNLRRLARELPAHRLADLTPFALQSWIQSCGLKAVTLRSVLRSAASPFAKKSLQALGLKEITNPFNELVMPKVDQDTFNAPTRSWIKNLMARGIRELKGDARKAFVLALGAGLRWGEIASLQCENAERGSVPITGRKAKGRRGRIVPIGKLIHSVLASVEKQGPVLAGNLRETHESLCAWLRKQGIKDQKPVHYLRKCYGSLAVGDHGIFVGSKLLGHSTITLTASTYAGEVDKLPAVKF